MHFCGNFEIFPKNLGNPAEMELLYQDGGLVEGACRETSSSHDAVSLREVNADGREQTQLYTSATEHAQQQ